MKLEILRYKQSRQGKTVCDNDTGCSEPRQAEKFKKSFFYPLYEVLVTIQGCFAQGLVAGEGKSTLDEVFWLYSNGNSFFLPLAPPGNPEFKVSYPLSDGKPVVKENPASEIISNAGFSYGIHG